MEPTTWRTSWILLVAMFSAGLGACALDDRNLTNVPPGAVQSGSRVLVQHFDAYSHYEEPARWVIRDADDWEQAWTQLAGTESALPAVDFEREMVLVAAMGAQRTGGYSIMVEDVFADANGIYVAVLETTPGPRCTVTQALTAPVTVVTIPRTDRPVFWVEQSRTISC